MPDPIDMILPMLREMREETRRGFEEMRRSFREVSERFDRVERRVDTHRDLIASESILGRYAAKEVEERLTALERKVESLEARKT